MLILNCRINESFYIGDDIKVTVLEMHSSHISIGINAPKIIPVHREEIYEKIKAEEEKEENE
jgi:carbon storage regulator